MARLLWLLSKGMPTITFLLLLLLLQIEGVSGASVFELTRNLKRLRHDVLAGGGSTMKADALEAYVRRSPHYSAILSGDSGCRESLATCNSPA